MVRLAVAFAIVCTPMLFTLQAAAQALPQDRASAIREILTLQDQRSVSDGRLYEFLDHKDSEVRFRALIAFANIQDTTTTSAVAALLDDGVWRVRQAAAFTLGQIGDARAGRPLSERLERETTSGVIGRILEALGKCGDMAALESVLRYRPGTTQELRKADQALSLARFALRTLRSERTVRFAASLLADESSAVQWTALYALWRSAPDSSLAPVLRRHAARLKELARSPNPDVRRNLALLCARVQSNSSRSVLAELEKRETWPGNWRVRTEIVRALAAHVSQEDDFVRLLSKHLGHRSENVRMATLAAFATSDAKAIRRSKWAKSIREQLSSIGSSSRQPASHRSEAFSAMALLFPKEYNFTRLLDRTSTSGAVSAGITRSLGYLPSERHIQIVLERLTDRSLAVAMAAWETIPAIVKNAKLERSEQLAPIAGEIAKSVKATLLRNDMALTTLVAQAVADTTVMGILNAEGLLRPVTEDLMLAYATLSSPNDVEAMQALVMTLGAIGDARAVPVLERALRDPDRTVAVRAASSLERLTGGEYQSRVAPSSDPLYTDYDWKTLEGIREGQEVEIVTSRGTITIELLPDVAPFTVLSFVKLTRKTFYDGLSFHRVVPDFVIQGGDPRGDGWGGPGYSIRTETGLQNYYRGMVGIASAGKDTEGCQFFITHSSQPHLDGRYTIFARVVGGISVVDAIQVGDSITKITLKQARR